MTLWLLFRRPRRSRQDAYRNVGQSTMTAGGRSSFLLAFCPDLRRMTTIAHVAVPTPSGRTSDVEDQAFVLCGVACCAPLLVASASAQQDVPPLVPWPKRVEMKPGTMDLTAQSRIVAADPALLPLAKILADELQAAAGVRLAAAEGKARPGDIVLATDAALKGEAHAVEIGDRATVRGGNYGAVALGTATLLQAVRVRDGKATLPRMSVADEPAVEYRGLMIDVARKYHSIAGLKQIVQLCRLYKIRYLQLHLTDDQSFMFPSKAYPLLATKNQHGGKTYTLEELKDLVAYADARNVTDHPRVRSAGTLGGGQPGHARPVRHPRHETLRASRFDQLRQGRRDEGRGHDRRRDVRGLPLLAVLPHWRRRGRPGVGRLRTPTSRPHSRSTTCRTSTNSTASSWST